MIKCQFSEKLFESLVNREILNKFYSKYSSISLLSPSQNQEAKTGYDACFSGGPKRCLAIQYKLSFKYERKNVKTKIKKGDIKIDIYKSKKNGYNQHNQLVKHNNKKKIMAFYCAPRFSTLSELQDFAQRGILTSQCVWFFPSNPLPKKDKHNHIILLNSKTNKAEMRSANHFDVEVIDFDDYYCLSENIKDIEPDLNLLECQELKTIIFDDIDSSDEMFFVLF